MKANLGIDPALVDFDVLDAWMDRQRLPGGAIADVEALAGGTQNTLIRFSRGGRAYVLRRGPRHLRPISNDVMRREMRVLTPEQMFDSLTTILGKGPARVETRDRIQKKGPPQAQETFRRAAQPCLSKASVGILDR